MAEGIKLTALGKELESNLTRTNTFVYVVNDGQSYKIPIDDLIFDGIIVIWLVVLFITQLLNL